MHPVANEVEVSTEQVEKYLLQWAKPGYTGQRRVYVKVLAEAGSQVVFIPSGNEVQRTKAPPSEMSPNVFGDSNLPTERETMVRVGIAQNKHRFRLGMKLTAVLANFVDGRLMGFEWETVG
jgi:hypothetical protein